MHIINVGACGILNGKLHLIALTIHQNINTELTPTLSSTIIKEIAQPIPPFNSVIKTQPFYKLYKEEL